MSRRDDANAVLFVEKPGPLLCHLRPPIVPKLGTHSYGQNPISIELNPYCHVDTHLRRHCRDSSFLHQNEPFALRAIRGSEQCENLGTTQKPPTFPNP